jgi:hypothetical protein
MVTHLHTPVTSFVSASNLFRHRQFGMRQSGVRRARLNRMQRLSRRPIHVEEDEGLER